VWLGRRTAADSTATEKLVYSGSVTGKRTEHVESAAAGPGHTPTVETRHLLALDGVEFRVSTSLYGLVEPGQRAELHCIRAGEPFRIVRA
jgi:hypothetical protein